MFFQLSLNESCNCTDRFGSRASRSIKNKVCWQQSDSEGASFGYPRPLRHRYLDELAVRSVPRQKLAAGDREIDLLRPFVAAGMRHDVPNFVAVREQGPGVGNE